MARRMVIAGHDPGQPPVILRVYLNPYGDLKLTAQAGREYAGAGQARQILVVNSLDNATRLSSTRARWLVRCRSSGVPVQ